MDAMFLYYILQKKSIQKFALFPNDTLFQCPKVNGIMLLVLHKILNPPCCVSDDWGKLKTAFGVGMASSGINFVKVVVKIGQIF